MAVNRYEYQISAGRTQEEPHISSHGKHRPAPGVWLGADNGQVLRIPLSGDSDTQRARGLVLMSSSGVGEEEVSSETLRAARWLMPNLPPELIAQALQWSAPVDS